MQERLAQSLHNAVRLTLAMERQDYRVQRPFSATVALQSQSPLTLATGTRIVEVFDRPELARQLLILGEPGAGKTTMMLELAEDLLQRATADKAEPIPVLISLSSWKNPEQSFFEWLVNELKRKYGRLFRAQQWLEKNQLLPLLDGLDEVAPQHQQACAVALNAWLTGELVQRPCGVVICCRREEFEQVVRQPLSLYGAIYLQALTVEQIEDYFAQVGLQDVWQTVQQDEALQELLTRPLFLSMFGWVQKQGKFSLSDWRSRTTSDRKIEYLLDTYWDAAITRELIIDPNDKQRCILSKTYGTKPLPTPKAVQRALVFVAKVLEQESQTDFLIEALQPCHLFSKELKETYCIRVKWGIDLILGLLFGIFIGFTEKSPSGLIAVIIFVLASGKKPEFFQKIQPVESLGWSWLRARSALKIALFALLIVVPALLFGFLFLRPKINLFLGVIATIVIGITLGLTAGVFGVDIESKRIPNQGILKSAASFLMVSLIGGILLGVIFGLSIKLTGQSTNWFVTGIGALLFLGLILGLNFGGYACIQHLALRLILYRNGSISWDYARFLNYATERLLLQRIGGRYRFMHKLLQDHFAKIDLG